MNMSVETVCYRLLIIGLIVPVRLCNLYTVSSLLLNSIQLQNS